MSAGAWIVVTGAAGRVGGVGRALVELLRRRYLTVRALVRPDIESPAALRVMSMFRGNIPGRALCAEV
jgi:uncharacterized protein YbjT (DUF2867 family)